MPHLDPVSEIFVSGALIMVGLLALVCAGMAAADWSMRRRNRRDVERCGSAHPRNAE